MPSISSQFISKHTTSTVLRTKYESYATFVYILANDYNDFYHEVYSPNRERERDIVFSSTKHCNLFIGKFFSIIIFLWFISFSSVIHYIWWRFYVGTHKSICNFYIFCELQTHTHIDPYGFITWKSRGKSIQLSETLHLWLDYKWKWC